ncbi:hypothetical protein DAI22_11g090800 [Oryza sativa Japonica Group]|nr:hypothetical protein DAI22_11g090800 [Oryza sativa Japonica Group]KAF2910303.1 hypothetical protein DAI22_11g090800 [Oryza sativa Japonica Group]
MRGLFRAGSRGRTEAPILCSHARDDAPLVFLMLTAAVFHQIVLLQVQRGRSSCTGKVRRMAWEGSDAGRQSIGCPI